LRCYLVRFAHVCSPLGRADASRQSRAGLGYPGTV